MEMNKLYVIGNGFDKHHKCLAAMVILRIG